MAMFNSYVKLPEGRLSIAGSVFSFLFFLLSMSPLGVFSYTFAEERNTDSSWFAGKSIVNKSWQ